MYPNFNEYQKALDYSTRKDTNCSIKLMTITDSTVLFIRNFPLNKAIIGGFLGITLWFSGVRSSQADEYIDPQQVFLAKSEGNSMNPSTNPAGAGGGAYFGDEDEKVISNQEFNSLDGSHNSRKIILTGSGTTLEFQQEVSATSSNDMDEIILVKSDEYYPVQRVLQQFFHNGKEVEQQMESEDLIRVMGVGALAQLQVQEI